MKTALSFASLFFASVLALTVPVQAANFYQGKRITIVVGFSAGGGYDTYARDVARYIGKYIPGHPRVIVQNMPGAGSLTAVRYLDVTAPTDGTVITVFNNGLVTRSIVQPKLVKVDFSKMAWLGVVTPDFRVCYGYGPHGIKSWDELMHSTKPFILGSTGKGAGNYINGAVLRLIFHAKVKQVLGFPGSAQQRLAVERGTLDGDCGSYSSIPLNWKKKGLVHAFVRFTRERPPEIPASAVYIGKFAKTDAQKKLLEVLDGGNELGRPFIMSKKVPADRLAILRKAFDETMKDPEFLAVMAKQRRPVHPVTAEQAEKIVGELMSVPADIVAKAKVIYQ